MEIWYCEPERCMNYGLKSDFDNMTITNFMLSTNMKCVELFLIHGYNQCNGIELTSNDPDYVPILKMTLKVK